MTTAPSTALVTIQPAFTDPERLALAGFLAGYRGLTRDAYALLCRERHKKAYADPQVMPRWPGGSVPVVGRGRFERHNAAGQSPSRKVSRLSGAV
jgi:hypothetical protein